MAIAGLRVRVVTSGQGIRVQFLPVEHARRGRAVQELTATGELNTLQIQVIPGFGDTTCLQCSKVDAAANPI